MRLGAGAGEGRNQEGQNWAADRAGGSQMEEEGPGACLAAYPWERTLRGVGVAFAAIAVVEGPEGGREEEDRRPGEARLCQRVAVGKT